MGFRRVHRSRVESNYQTVAQENTKSYHSSLQEVAKVTIIPERSFPIFTGLYADTAFKKNGVLEIKNRKKQTEMGRLPIPNSRPRIQEALCGKT